MGKHLDGKTKYNYIMRYKNGESPTKLGRELQDLGLVDIKSNHRTAIQSAIYRGVKQFNNDGIDGLISKSGKNTTGRPPKKEIHERYKDGSKEELLEHIIDMEEWFEKKGYGKKSFFEYINLNKKHSISKLCKALEVSRSGYYKGVANGKKTTGNYDEELIEKIKFLFSYKKEVFGYRRIKVSLEREFGIFVSPNTVRRYMVHLGLKSKIRRQKKKRELKITDRTFPDLINRKGKSTNRHENLFTDVTYIRTTQGGNYLSVVLDGFNNEVVSGEFSKFNNINLVYDNILDSMRKIDYHCDAILHSDHSFQYFSKELKELRGKLGFRQSMGRVGVSLDNRPIEYFFSILKQEYMPKKSLDYEKTRELISSSIYDYNNKRFQGCLKNMTPREYAETYKIQL